jgi:type I restriction enzyme R subunit
MNSRFEKYKKALSSRNPDETESAKAELHRTFASLTQEEQKYANIFLHDIESGDAAIEEGKTLRDYINEYIKKAKNDQIHCVASMLGLDETMLRNMMAMKVDESNINEYGKLDNLKATVDKTKAKAYFEAVENVNIAPPKANIKVDKLLRDFIISGGYEIPLP